MAPHTLQKKLARLRQKRKERKVLARRPPRRALGADDRKLVLSKTGGRCHLCGGAIKGKRWEADHVLAAAGGGQHRHDNYLPAHQLCNNYRWHYLPEEFQLVLKLGVWAKTQIEKNTLLGKAMAEGFGRHEAARKRRKRTT